VVRPGGTVCILEFFRPARPRVFFDKVWNARVLPLIGWAVTGHREAYQYLPASIDRFLSRVEFEDAMRTAGFADVRGHDLFPAGVASLVVAR
jgi:ubiquinone/menaquinone biosynthesis C-methylase UbiE